MRLIYKVLIVGVVVVLGFWFVLYSYNAILGLGEKGDTFVPNFRGIVLDNAQLLAKQAHLTLFVEREEYSPDVPQGEIISQDPDAGMEVKRGRIVRVVVSKGVQMVTVPDVRGYNLEQAAALLQNAGLKQGEVSTAQSAEGQKGLVVSQNPLPGVSVKEGSSVDLVVSSGPPPSVNMPNLMGKNLEEAKHLLQGDKLELGQIGWRWDENQPAGTILTQNPAPSEKVLEGSMVSLVVSAGSVSNGEDLPFKQSYITINLPQFDGEKKVAVWITDELSTSQVYEGMHKGGDVIRLMVSSFGNTTVEVKLGDEVLSNGKL
jgi:beta-lactam-binding protein with PASTA domain